MQQRMTHHVYTGIYTGMIMDLAGLFNFADAYYDFFVCGTQGAWCEYGHMLVNAMAEHDFHIIRFPPHGDRRELLYRASRLM